MNKEIKKEQVKRVVDDFKRFMEEHCEVKLFIVVVDKQFVK